jgi:hypothetical protein
VQHVEPGIADALGGFIDPRRECQIFAGKRRSQMT